jgi:hypothetical protein
MISLQNIPKQTEGTYSNVHGKLQPNPGITSSVYALLRLLCGQSVVQINFSLLTIAAPVAYGGVKGLGGFNPPEIPKF